MQVWAPYKQQVFPLTKLLFFSQRAAEGDDF